MTDEQTPTARYRNRAGTSELLVYPDPEGPSPLPKKPWMRFIACESARYAHGHGQLDIEALEARHRSATQAGSARKLAINVYIAHRAQIVFTTFPDRHQWDPRIHGLLLLQRNECERAGIDWKEAGNEAERILRAYGDYVNGWCWRYQFYHLDRCNLNHVHRTESHAPEEGRGPFWGNDIARSGLLRAAGIAAAGDPAKLDPAWLQIGPDDDEDFAAPESSRRPADENAV